jgi:alpha-beta hydrolase superfamily lysophospholipase
MDKMRKTPSVTVWARAGAVAATLALLAGAVVADAPPSAAAGGTRRGSPGLPAFYAVPSHLPSDKPGTLIKDERVSSKGVDGTVYRVMYVSESETGKPIAVTGLVMVPTTPPPAAGYPVVTWAHGTNGMAPQCAPSLDPGTAVPLQNDLLQQGWEVTASDYQGEGTSGLLPYLAGNVSARNTIDIVTAARHLKAAHASDSYAVWGHSEGGQTAMFALHIAASYAPSLHLVGVVAGAPPSQFSVIYTFLKTSPYRFYLFMAAEGYNIAYGNAAAPLTEVLTARAIKLQPVLSKGCFTYVEKAVDKYQLATLVKTNPFALPKWKVLLEANDPESFTTPSQAPLLIPQGGADEQIPVVSTQLLATHLCKIGQDVERWIYPGKTHAGVIPFYMGDMVHWLSDRFAGDPNPDPYAPTGVTGVQTSTCP